MKTSVLIAVLTIAALCGRPAAGQDPGSDHDAASVVRALLDRDAVVRMPVKGRLRQSIEKDTNVLEMPQGPSRVLLVRLPDASTPYDIIVRSGRSSALVFTESVGLRRVVPEFDFVARGLGLKKEPRLETTISIAPQDHERFILLYGLSRGSLELETVPSKK